MSMPLPSTRLRRIVLAALTGAALCQPLDAASQTLNMSVDLVRLGIANRNLTPDDPTLDARPLFQAAVNYVRNNNFHALTLERGAYYFLTPQSSSIYLQVVDLSDVTIDLAGSTIYFQDARRNGMTFQYCQRVTLANFTTDYLNPPYTHARVSSVDLQNRRILYTTISGWSDPVIFAGDTKAIEVSSVQAVVFRNGESVPGSSRMPVQAIAGGAIDLFQNTAPWTQAATLSTFQPGDTLVVTFRGGGPPIQFWQCDGVTVSNGRILGANGTALDLDRVANSVVDRVRVEPRPGALIGSTGDGIHFRRSLRSNHIRNSYVTRTVDDGLVIDAVMAGRVAARLGPRDLRVQRTFYSRFPDGATINFVDAATGSEIAGGAIVSQAPPDSRAIEFNGLVTLTFDRDLPAVAPDSAVVFADSSMRGAGSSIEDNIVEDLVMGRAIWIGGAVGVTVRRNVARRASQGGVVISQTAGGGGISQTTDHSGVARDVTIQSNVLDGNLGPMAQGTITQVCMASIAVVSFNSTGTGFQFLPSPLNTNILIRDNYIVDSGRTGIWMGETAGGRIENNLITRWYQQPHLPLWFVAPDVRAQVLEDHSQPSVLRYSAGVLVQNNDIRAASTIAAPVSFSTPVIALPSGGGASSFTVTPVVVGFQWKAVTADPWISVTTAEGTGSGTVAFSVSLNPGPSARTGYVTVAGQRVTVVQAGAPMITPGFMALAPAEVNGTLVRFNWSLPVGGQPATGFTLVARLVPGGTPVASLPVGAVQSLTVPAPAGVYYVRVFGTNAAGFGPDSNEVVVVVGGGAVPGAPRNLTAVVTGNAFLLAWTPPVNAAIAPVQTYVIDAGSVPGASDLASFATGSATTQFTTPMIPNGSYYISLRARNELGTGPASAEIRAIVGPPPPGAVTLSGSAGPGNSVSLSWTAPTTGAAVTGYQLQAGTMPGSSNAAVLNLPASTRSFTTAGVPSGRYYVRVVALSTQGPSPASNELTLMFP